MVVASCGDRNGGEVASKRSLLTAQCVDAADVPAGAWTCPDALEVECDQPQTLYVVDDETTACDGATLTVSDSGPFAPGTHTIVVSDGDEALCSAELTVTDTGAPALESHVVNLWPPNHKFHEVAVSDCVSAIDACDGEVQGEFIWASSDEPIDDIGDGHHAPDIGLGADVQHVCVRSERQGPKDGRVYTLGVRVVDRAGNESEGTCTVIVDHDQRGVTGSDSGEAYRVTFDPAQAGLNCDGTPGEGGSGGGGGASGGGGDDGGGGASGGSGDNGGGGAGAGGNGGNGGSPEAGAGGSDEGEGGTGGSDEGEGGSSGTNGGEPEPPPDVL